MTPRRGRLCATAALLLLGSACASRQAPPIAPRETAASTAPAQTVGEAFVDAFTSREADALWAVRLERLGSRDPLARLNDDRLVIPASNMKIATLAAAATRLGWDYRFRTRLYATGPLDGHVLRGDLVVVGGADPTLGHGDDPFATFRAWARALRAKGIARVDGALVGDPSRFGDEWIGNSWTWDDLPFGYAAAYSGLTFHENVVRVHVAPGAVAGALARVSLVPGAADVAIRSNVLTSVAGGPASIAIDREMASAALIVRGTIPLGGPPIERTAAIPDPAHAFLRALRASLAAEGIEIRGATRVAARPDVDEAMPMHEHASAPLSDVARRFMKVSQNLYGEALLRVMASDTGRPASPAAAREAMRETLESLGVPPASVNPLDGSGLSRRDLVTARAVAGLLQTMAATPQGALFRATLPIAGQDGTLASRFSASPCAGRLAAKTGTLSGVRALGGYVTSASGEEYVFVVIANNFVIPTRDVDAIVEGALAAVCR